MIIKKVYRNKRKVVLYIQYKSFSKNSHMRLNNQNSSKENWKRASLYNICSFDQHKEYENVKALEKRNKKQFQMQCSMLTLNGTV